jgi:hypothetical protein
LPLVQQVLVKVTIDERTIVWMQQILHLKVYQMIFLEKELWWDNKTFLAAYHRVPSPMMLIVHLSGQLTHSQLYQCFPHAQSQTTSSGLT